MTRRDPLVAIHHIHDHGREALEMVRERSRTDLDSDRMFELALVRLMEVVGEASRRVPPNFRARYPDVPWRETTDLRNRLIHGYDQINFDRLWTIIHDELPGLVARMEEILVEHGRLGR